MGAALPQEFPEAQSSSVSLTALLAGTFQKEKVTELTVEYKVGSLFKRHCLPLDDPHQEAN